MNEDKLSPVEIAKRKSRGLRGTLSSSLNNQVTGALASDDQHLVKFHGIYQQDDRDRREERAAKKLEPAFSFMARLRLPGGDCSAKQWLGIQEIATKNGSGVVKITTRQTVQIHGVVKSVLRPSLKDFAALGLDSIAACGDVNRNVMAGSQPAIQIWHAEVHKFAQSISEHLLPKTKAFYEVFVDGEELLPDKPVEEDALYQDRYLPRKFKIALAIPPHNEVDVFANDIGLIAIEEKNGAGSQLAGFNVVIGGGMGATHGNAATYPRVASPIGFITPDKVLDVCWQVAAVQRDFGNRADRKQARLKYTIDRMGLEAFCAELHSRLGFQLESPRAYKFEKRGDMYGWQVDHSGLWHYTIFVENGLVRDTADYRIKSFLTDYAEQFAGALRFTGNQNIMLLSVKAQDKNRVEALLKQHSIDHSKLTALRKDALACVALPTCPLALAEAQRYLPQLIEKIELLLSEKGLSEQPISVRMTGCPNGCARPYLAEIGLVGTNPGQYNLHIGADHLGARLNTLYKNNLSEAEILDQLGQLFTRFKAERLEREHFGDFVYRAVLT